MKCSKCEIFTVVCAGFLVFSGIAMWASFWPIFNSQLISNYKLGANYDGSLKYATFLYSNPPMKNVMKFHFFNVTNPDEVKYLGAKPELIDVGGYAFLESEKKKYYDFNADQTQMFYQNYKQYHYSPENNDEGFDYDDYILFPNPLSTGAVATIFTPTSGFSQNLQTIVAIGLVLMGEYPMISHKMKDILFEGFEDPLLDIAHSKIFITIVKALGKEESLSVIPEMRSFAYMSGYNNSFDENYWINTGKDNFDKLGFVESWADLKELPESFWSTEEARKIVGSDSGSLSKLHLTENDTLPFFLSFMCRSFQKKFWSKGMVDGIHTMRFSVPEEDFDTTLEKNAGFRYKNVENVDYFPEWSAKQPENGTSNGTHLLPPGLFPLVCYPGHNSQPPFTVLVSPPHFLYSPPEVQHHLSGMSPDPEKHTPMVFYQEKVSGTPLQVDVRFQVNMPVIKNRGSVMTSQLPNVIIPLFYEDSRAVVADFVLNTVWLGVIIVPMIIDYLKFVLIFVGVCMLTVLLFIKVRTRKTTTIL